MKIRTGLRLSAVGVAWLSLAPAAFAGGEATSYPANALVYSAQTVAASATNQVTLPSGVIVYRFTAGAAVGDTIVFRPPTGASFIAPAPTGFVAPAGVACAVGPGAIAAGVLTYTVTAACPAVFGTIELTLSSATLSGLSGLASPPGGPAAITAQGTFAAAANGSDTSPVPVLTLFSEDTYELFTSPLSPPLTINLSGQAGSTPGTQFDNGTGGISPAGFLGTLRLRARQDLDAATGQPLASASDGYAQRHDFREFLLRHCVLSRRQRKPGLLRRDAPRRRHDGHPQCDEQCDHLYTPDPGSVSEWIHLLGRVHRQQWDRRRRAGTDTADPGDANRNSQRGDDEL